MPAHPSIIVGSGSFTLIVEGIGFLPTSVVRWDGADRSTTCISMPAEDVDTKGTVNLTVYNPAPGSGTSDVYALLIDDRHSYLPLILRP
ncbi:MAG: hypothetical protein JXR32_02580 [Anaerolineaceae bacterium]|nr:hypothetical protein [Anaerolineaceae bacterium]